MKIKIYVGYENQEILTEKQYQEALAERAKSYEADEPAFEDWLIDRYSAYEIFKMKSHELDKVIERWKSVCETDAKEDMSRELIEYELEI